MKKKLAINGGGEHLLKTRVQHLVQCDNGGSDVSSDLFYNLTNLQQTLKVTVYPVVQINTFVSALHW